MVYQIINSGSMAPVELSNPVIADRFNLGPVPGWAVCEQLMTDPFNPGDYILAGWLAVIPYMTGPSLDAGWI